MSNLNISSDLLDDADNKLLSDSISEFIESGDISSSFVENITRANEITEASRLYVQPSTENLVPGDKIIVTGSNISITDISDAQMCTPLNSNTNEVLTDDGGNYTDFFLSCADLAYYNERDKFGIQYNKTSEEYKCYIDQISNSEQTEEKTILVGNSPEYSTEFVIDIKEEWVSKYFINLAGKTLFKAITHGASIEEFVFESKYCGAYIKTDETTNNAKIKFEKECYYYFMTYDFIEKLKSETGDDSYTVKFPNNILNIDDNNVNDITDLHDLDRGNADSDGNSCYYVNSYVSRASTEGQFPWKGWYEDQQIANANAALAALSAPSSYVKVNSNVIKTGDYSDAKDMFLKYADASWDAGGSSNIDSCYDSASGNYRFLMHHNGTCYGTDNPSQLKPMNAFTIKSQRDNKFLYYDNNKSLYKENWNDAHKKSGQENKYNFYFKPVIQTKGSNYYNVYEIINVGYRGVNSIFPHEKDSTAGKYVILDFSKANTSETFHESELNSKQFSNLFTISNLGIINFDNGQYLCNDGSKYGVPENESLFFNRSHLGDWEQFTLQIQDNRRRYPNGNETYIRPEVCENSGFPHCDTFNKIKSHLVNVDNDTFYQSGNTYDYNYNAGSVKFKTCQNKGSTSNCGNDHTDLYFNSELTNSFSEQYQAYEALRLTYMNDISYNSANRASWQRGDPNAFTMLCHNNINNYNFLKSVTTPVIKPYITVNRDIGPNLNLTSDRSDICIQSFKTIKTAHGASLIITLQKQDDTGAVVAGMIEELSIPEYINGYDNSDIYLRPNTQYDDSNVSNTDDIFLNANNNFIHNIPSDDPDLNKSYMIKLDVDDANKPTGVIRITKTIAKQCYKSKGMGTGYGVGGDSGISDLSQTSGDAHMVHIYNLNKTYNPNEDDSGTYKIIDNIDDNKYTFYSDDASNNSNIDPSTITPPNPDNDIAYISDYYIKFSGYKFDSGTLGQFFIEFDEEDGMNTTSFTVPFAQYRFRYTEVKTFMTLYKNQNPIYPNIPPLFIIQDTENDKWYFTTHSAYKYFDNQSLDYKDVIRFTNKYKRLDSTHNLYVIKYNYTPRLVSLNDDRSKAISQDKYSEIEPFSNIKEGYTNNINIYKETFKMNNINKAPLFNDEGISLKEGLCNISEEFKKEYNYDFPECDDCSDKQRTTDNVTHTYCDTIQKLSNIYHLEKDISNNNATIDELVDYDAANYKKYLKEKNFTKATLEAQAEDSIINNKSNNLEIIAISIVGILAIGLVYTISKKI